MIRETIIENPYVPDDLNGHAFPSVPQAYFLACPAIEALYGGAAGGGKSAALLAGALQYVTVPGYAAILFRRTLTDLEMAGSLIPMSHQWLQGTDASWNGSTYQWTFPNGATLSFGYIKGRNDHFRYKGAAWQYVGFDELTSFEHNQYRFLFGRIRKPDEMDVPLRCRSASNPGDRGHEWVKRRLIDGSDGVDRVFVPAKLEDNPGLDRESYELMLNELDPVTRAQMRHGDWDVRPEGNLFRREWFKDKVVDRLPGPLEFVRRWDLAATKAAKGKDPDYAAGCLLAKTPDNRFFVCGMEHFRESPRETEKRLIATAKRDGKRIAVRLEQEPGSAAKLYVDSLANRMSGYDVRGVPSMADKVTRAKPASAACERGDVYLLAGPWLEAFLDELCAFPNVAHDDQVDAFTGGFADLTGGTNAWDAADWRQVFGETAADDNRDAGSNRVRAEARGDSLDSVSSDDADRWSPPATDDDESGW